MPTQSRVDHKALAVAQLHRAFGKPPDADFWPLQINQQTHCPTLFGCAGAHQFGPAAVIIAGAMGHVETRHINTLIDQGRHHFRPVCGWTQRDDDLGATLGAHRVICLVCRM